MASGVQRVSVAGSWWRQAPHGGDPLWLASPPSSGRWQVGSNLAAIYLAGGSSRIPLVSRTIQQHMGQVPESWDDPKAVTVLGAARLPSAPATASTAVAPERTTRQYPLMTRPAPPRRIDHRQ